MSQASNVIAFQPRANLHRSIEYRPHVKWSYYFLLSVAVAFFLLPASFALPRILKGDMNANLLLITFGATSGALIGFVAHMLRRVAFAKIHVTSSQVEIVQGAKKTTIPFTEIESIKFVHLSYMDGSFKLNLKSKASFRFTVVLERSEYILEAIAAARPDLFAGSELETYRRTAIVVDHSWARFYAALKNWKSLALKFVALPLALALISTGILSATNHHADLMKNILFFVVTNTFVGSALWSAMEFVHIAKERSALLANPNFLRLDLNAGAEMARKALRAHFALLFVAFAVWLALKLL